MAPLGSEAEFQLPGALGGRERRREVTFIREAGPYPTAGLGVGETQVGPLWGCFCVSQTQGRRNLGALNGLALGQRGAEGGAIHRAAEGSNVAESVAVTKGQRNTDTLCP